MDEIWKPVFGYEGVYEVSDLGSMRSLDRFGYKNRAGGVVRGKDMKPFVDSGNGYLYVNLCRNGKVKKIAVHTLVLEAFIGSRPPKHEACHKDGVRTNPVLTNLRWDTPKENWADKRRHGTATVGEKSGAAKLSLEQVHLILESKINSIKLSKELGVASSTIRAIRLGTNWKHLGMEIEAPRRTN